MKWQIIFILIAFSTDVVISFFCPTITVTNSQHYNGEYWLDKNSQCYSRHSWVRTDGHLHLYYLFNSHDGWVISTNDCQSWGGFVALIKSPELSPWKVNGSWTEFHTDGTSHPSNISMLCQWTPSGGYTKSCLSNGCKHEEACVHKGDGFECVSEANKESEHVSANSLNVALLLFSVLMTLTLLLACVIMVKLFRNGNEHTGSFVYEEMDPSSAEAHRRSFTNPIVININATKARKDISYEQLVVS